MSMVNLTMPTLLNEALPANLEDGAGHIAVARTLGQPKVAVQSVSAKQLAELLDAPGTHLLDVRTPGEFEALRIAGAVNAPLDRLDPAALLASIGPNDPVYVVCQAGTRSQFAAAERRAVGFSRVVPVDGGTKAGPVAGLPGVPGNPVRA